MRFREHSRVKKEIELLRIKVEEAELKANELIDSLNFYTSLEINEHKNKAKDELDNINGLAEQKQKSSTQHLNRLRVAAEKDKVETAPQILWAVTAILVSLTATYWLFPTNKTPSISKERKCKTQGEDLSSTECT